MLHGGTPFKSVAKSVSYSPSKNSPSKMAMRLEAMKKAIETPHIKSPRIRPKKNYFKDDLKTEDYQLLAQALQVNDLPLLLKTFSTLNLKISHYFIVLRVQA